MGYLQEAALGKMFQIPFAHEVEMQEYTRSKLRELQEKLLQRYQEKWDEYSDSPSVSHRSSRMVEFLLEETHRLIDDLMAIEKDVLLHDVTTLRDDYFDKLKEELIQTIHQIFFSVYSEIRYIDALFSPFLLNRVGMLKEAVGLRVCPPTAAIDAVTFYRSVQGKIEGIAEMGNGAAAGLFERLLDAIHNSGASAETRVDQMQNVEFLVAEYHAPPDKRNHGVIKAALSFLSAAANLKTSWAELGPGIRGLFE